MTGALPTARDEAWRYSDHKALQRALALPVNGVVRRTTSTADLAMVALAEQYNAGSDITFTDGVRTDLPRLTGDGATHTRETWTVPAGATATVLESQRGAGWLNVAVDIQLEPGATLRHILRQERGAEATSTLTLRVSVAAGARYEAFVLNTGGAFGRIELRAVLTGDGAHVDVSGVQLGDARQTLEIVTQLDHEAPGTTARQAVKTVLTGQATGSYLGKVKVHPGAQLTDSEQSSKALLLKRTATANTKPELEIYADDVKCAHGATVGELDKAALFYLQSRGLSPAEAKALLTEAFVADLVQTIADDAARDAIGAATAQRLHAMLAGDAA
jgi:Fe-S cluster assembly protein SufD